MNLSGTQIKDTYGNLITIGTVAGTPTTGTLQNGAGSDLTTITVAGTLNATTLGGTLSTAAQTNVTSLGTLTGLSVSGTTGLNGAVTINDTGADVDFRVEGDTNTHLIFADASVDKVMIGGSSSGGGGRLEAVGGSIGINGIYGTAGCKTIVGGFDIPANTTLTVTIDLKLTSFRGGFQCHANTYLSSAQGAGQLFFVGGGRFDSTASRADIHVVRNSTPDIDLTFGTPAGGGGFNIVTFTVANADASATGVLFIYLTVFGDSFTADPTITIS